MNLIEILFEVVGVVGVVLPVAIVLIVGPSRLRRTIPDLRSRLQNAAPVLAVLGVVLAINSVVRDSGTNLSWMIGVNITGYIHAIEGSFVADLQSLATPTLTSYFGDIYIFGYTFLVVFPLCAYLFHDELQPLYEISIAYILNYSIGLLCYVAFIAYGPRNLIPELVEPLLYTSWPQSQLLTSEVNANTNVFPSLHTSLSFTVAFFSYRYRDIYVRWVPIAWVLAVSVATATMYLGIHWLTDVVCGVVLAVISVVGSVRIRKWLRRDATRKRIERIRNRVVTHVQQWRGSR